MNYCQRIIQLLTQIPPPRLFDRSGKREKGREKRERGKREERRGKREEGRGKREERREKREEGRGKRDEGKLCGSRSRFVWVDASQGHI